MSRQDWRKGLAERGKTLPARGDKVTVIHTLDDRRFMQATILVPDSATYEDVDNLLRLVQSKLVDIVWKREETDGRGDLQGTTIDDSEREPSQPESTVS